MQEFGYFFAVVPFVCHSVHVVSCHHACVRPPEHLPPAATVDQSHQRKNTLVYVCVRLSQRV